MKFNKIILPAIVCALALSSCEDNKMEWGKPDGYGDVNISDIPLELQEKIANYDVIKAYAAQYLPGQTIGLGLGADLYLENEAYRQVADDNFQMFTTGNAMKHESVVTNKGELNFDKIDAFLAAIPTDMPVYGHNFLWHTQQRQQYLKSLIAPEMKVETGDDEKCENVITNSGFENGNTGWIFNGSGYKGTIVDEGYASAHALQCTMTETSTGNYDSQLFWNLPSALKQGETYYLAFAAKSDPAINVQVIGQNQADYDIAIYKETFTMTDSWKLYEYELTFEDDKVIDKIGLQFGGTPNSILYLDDFKFGKKKETEVNYCTNGSFESEKGLDGWELANSGAGISIVELEDAISKTKVLKMVSSETSANAWSLQLRSPEIPSFPNQKVQISFWVKSEQAGKGRIALPGWSNETPYMDWLGTGGNWTEFFETTTEWQHITILPQKYNTDFKEGTDTWKLQLNFGYLPNVTYYIDDIKVTLVEEAPTAKSLTRSGGISYIIKPIEEKRAALLGAMETWIKGMAEHEGMERVVAWDVINEPISDNNQWRGVNGNFSSEDATPTEDETTGLNLNWANGHFYWGYYLDKEYAVKAFEYARKYTKEGTKLFVNDYNLEINPNKLQALIDMVKYIDENNENHRPIVDGIGTQMHLIAKSITKEQIDAMFQTLAATGKLIRVTELDVRLEENKTPTADDLMLQADIYRWVFESYKQYIPAEQQSGITIWDITDDTSWYKEYSPCIFDANLTRKPAYKGVCDGIAGRDISEDFTGDDWKAGK